MLIQTGLGKTTFSKETISKFVSMAIDMTDGLVLSSTYIGSITRKLTGNTAGIELREHDKGIDIHISIIVQYGMRLHEVCRDLQYKVKDVLEDFTGIIINAIHLKIDGIAV
ncbi:Asp23/Gls24 family envelope stress response protein [Paenibacillus polysaccharolyticus]|uniref:Asp23/Gls24 family envelope stress response protein n=1 Tax=Paenibacillus polysaccharolyticus TaxID=582692 RepID=UPI0020A22B5A|nr:Asp23/Gls24 family envelope stress response protein [Paenibacillus polysaccharolyticus]MCP1133632.1 Asp23/Gls24 family envelope stress response protein [Paenibacillus polysaccharolyticus]